ncbi:MAG TPA: glycoside hydrolase family 5 protein [Polyangiaceae bacterium]|jgi:endoglucanase
MSHTRSIVAGLVALLLPLACSSQTKTPIEAGTENLPEAAVEAGSALPAVPFHTQSRWIMDANNHRFKLAGVSWYGGESQDLVPLGLDHADVHAIAALIKQFGFNSVRIPWALQMYESNPVVATSLVSANPSLQGKTVLEVLDAVIEALAQQGLVVILDNHRSRGDWCCDTAHGDGLWHTAQYPESSWIADWQGMVDRYKSQPAVIGADLRNEIRGEVPDDASGCVDCDSPADAGCACLQPSWGDGNPLTDWAAAAERGGNAVLERNPSLLVIVEGNFWATWFGATYRQVHLSVPDRLVYSPHNYSSTNGGVASFASYDAFKSALDSAWGYIVTEGQPYTAPVWLGEFGTNHTSPSPVWWPWIEQYVTEKDLDWCFWALNGTQGSGYGRTFGAVETFGVLNAQWTDTASPSFLGALQALAPATMGP